MTTRQHTGQSIKTILESNMIRTLGCLLIILSFAQACLAEEKNLLHGPDVKIAAGPFAKYDFEKTADTNETVLNLNFSKCEGAPLINIDFGGQTNTVKHTGIVLKVRLVEPEQLSFRIDVDFPGAPEAGKAIIGHKLNSKSTMEIPIYFSDTTVADRITSMQISAVVPTKTCTLKVYGIKFINEDMVSALKKLTGWSSSHNIVLRKERVDGKDCLVWPNVFQPRTSGYDFTTLCVSFPPTNLEKYGRLRFDVKVCTELPTPSLAIAFLDSSKLFMGLTSDHYVPLINGQWVTAEWDFSMFERAKIDGWRISTTDFGVPSGMKGAFTVYFANMRLVEMPPSKTCGWDVDPGRIACSLGYKPYLPKLALAHGGRSPLKDFRIIDVQTGKVLLQKPWRMETYRLGKYGVARFDELTKTGNYRIDSSGLESCQFTVNERPYLEAEKAMIYDFFHNRRSGLWEGKDDAIDLNTGKHRDLSGGWFDAADTRRYFDNNCRPAFDMLVFRHYSRLDKLWNQRQERGTDDILSEAIYGNLYNIKDVTEEGGPLLPIDATHYTDDVVGTADDRPTQQKGFYHQVGALYGAATLARFARETKGVDRQYSAQCLAAARRIWRFATEKDYALSVYDKYGIKKGGCRESYETLQVYPELRGYASLELFQATGEKEFETIAFECANIMVKKCREDKAIDLSLNKERITYQLSNAGKLGDIPIVFLSALCQKYPNHPDWISWYAAVRYFTTFWAVKVTDYFQPFPLMPLGIMSPDQLKKYEFRKDSLPKIGDGYLHFHSTYCPTFSWLYQAAAVAEAAQLCDDPALECLATRTLEYFGGLNPFARSLIGGVGNHPPAYVSRPATPGSRTDLPGTLVGFHGQPVMGKNNPDDLPYFPELQANPWREPWGIAVGAFLQLSGRLSHPALVQGRLTRDGKILAATEVELWHVRDPLLKTKTNADGFFKFDDVPGGIDIILRVGEVHVPFKTISSKTYDLQLDLQKLAKVEVELPELLKAGETAAAVLSITSHSESAGTHKVSILMDNLTGDNKSISVFLAEKETKTINFKVKPLVDNKPYLILAIPNDIFLLKGEKVGMVSSN